MSLAKKTYEGEPCIDKVYKDMQEAAAGEYYLCVASNVSPHMFGEHCVRPRIIFRMLRKSLACVSNEKEFCNKLHELDAEIAHSCESPKSFTSFLVDQGYGPPQPNPHTCAVKCPCLKPFLKESKRTKCKIHVCTCNACRQKGGKSCKWAARHARAWRAESPNLAQGATSFLGMCAERGLDVDKTVRTPRQRNMAELVYLECLKKLRCDVFESDAVYDRSQSFGRHALRTDGLLPTIATTSDLFVIRWGTTLSPAQLFTLMGFPYHLYEAAGISRMYRDDVLRRFIGNTIHPAVFGVCAATLLSLMKAPPNSDDRTDSDSGGDDDD